MLELVLEDNATCHGASPQPAFVPPTIFVKFPFFDKSPLLRDPEQGSHTEIIESNNYED